MMMMLYLGECVIAFQSTALRFLDSTPATMQKPQERASIDAYVVAVVMITPLACNAFNTNLNP